MEEYERLSRMIDSLLFLARSENAETVLQQAIFSGAKEVHAVADLFEAAAAEKGVTLETRGNAQLLGDAGLFRRAMSNLLDNALRHTPAGGRITVSIQDLETGGVAVRVQDTGSGISDEHLPRVFDRFYRADPSRHERGAGLGLAIVKSIADLHGASISLESEMGKGTSALLEFPSSRFMKPSETT
jgi:two-component system heavy metal sensor histidine kinase CusS